MNPIDFIHKVDLGDKLDSFIDELNYFSSIVNQLNPKTINCDFWCIGDDNCVTFVSHNNYPDLEILSPIEDANWANVAKITDRLNSFFDKYNLQRYIGKIHTRVWPIHRHVFDPSKQWSITVFDGEVDNSKLHFYKSTDNDTFSDTKVHDIKSFYDIPEPDYTQTIYKKDVYALRTWEWHSYDVEHKANLFLLYPKNLTTTESMTNYISSLKHL